MALLASPDVERHVPRCGKGSSAEQIKFHDDLHWTAPAMPGPEFSGGGEKAVGPLIFADPFRLIRSQRVDELQVFGDFALEED